MKRLKEEKEKEVQRLREQQEKATDRQADIDALRAKRAMEEADRKDRAREKREAEKTVKSLHLSINFLSKEFNRNYMKLENNKCLRKREEWLNKLNKKEMSSKESLTNKNYKENKNSKLREKDTIYFINMPIKSENKFKIKKKKTSKTEQNILKKEENSNKSSKLRRPY